MPLTVAHRATLAAFPDKESLIAVDYLQECNAMLPEVLLAYAGTTPHFVDGLPHEALWEWLHRTEPARVVYLSWTGRKRWEAVRNKRFGWKTHELAQGALGLRARKRRVLALFPEVQVPCPVCMAGRKPADPFDPCPRCQCQDVDAFGTIAAPGLIPRELPPVRPVSELVPPGSPH